MSSSSSNKLRLNKRSNNKWADELPSRLLAHALSYVDNVGDLVRALQRVCPAWKRMPTFLQDRLLSALVARDLSWVAARRQEGEPWTTTLQRAAEIDHNWAQGKFRHVVLPLFDQLSTAWIRAMATVGEQWLAVLRDRVAIYDVSQGTFHKMHSYPPPMPLDKFGQFEALGASGTTVFCSTS